MNRKERRLAKVLGAHWVAQRPSGLLEVCMGGEACGCRPGTRGPQARERAEDRRGPGGFAVSALGQIRHAESPDQPRG